jgi:hypothetical protein
VRTSSKQHHAADPFPENSERQHTDFLPVPGGVPRLDDLCAHLSSTMQSVSKRPTGRFCATPLSSAPSAPPLPADFGSLPYELLDGIIIELEGVSPRAYGDPDILAALHVRRAACVCKRWRDCVGRVHRPKMLLVDVERESCRLASLVDGGPAHRVRLQRVQQYLTRHSMSLRQILVNFPVAREYRPRLCFFDDFLTHLSQNVSGITDKVIQEADLRMAHFVSEWQGVDQVAAGQLHPAYITSQMVRMRQQQAMFARRSTHVLFADKHALDDLAATDDSPSPSPPPPPPYSLPLDRLDTIEVRLPHAKSLCWKKLLRMEPGSDEWATVHRELCLERAIVRLVATDTLDPDATATNYQQLQDSNRTAIFFLFVSPGLTVLRKFLFVDGILGWVRRVCAPMGAKPNETNGPDMDVLNMLSLDFAWDLRDVFADLAPPTSESEFLQHVTDVWAPNTASQSEVTAQCDPARPGRVALSLARLRNFSNGQQVHQFVLWDEASGVDQGSKLGGLDPYVRMRVPRVCPLVWLA